MTTVKTTKVAVRALWAGLFGLVVVMGMGCQGGAAGPDEGESGSSLDNVAIIQGMYDAILAQGSFQPLIDTFAEDGVIELTIPQDTPIAGAFRGRQGLQTYIERVNEVFEPEEIRLDDFIAHGDKVIVYGFERARIKQTGRMLASMWAGVFTMSNGKIAHVVFIEDMSELTDAYRQQP